ncbi:MAG: hypothetical protein WBQ34_16680 [Candidatus Acidiferrales bacterium]
MSETATSASETPQPSGAEKRRSTRVVQAVPIIVVGTDALGQPFRESTSTMMVDCYGCKFQSQNYVPKNSTVTMEIFHAPGWDRRVVRGRVVWVQRPRTHRENYQIAMEMDVPGNVWGLAPGPSDWFPHPDDVAQMPIEVLDPPPSETVREITAEAEGIRDAQSEAEYPSPEEQISEEQSIVAQAEIGPADAEEFTFTREQLDGELREAIGKTLRSMIERAAEDSVRDLIQDVSDRSSALVEAARRISQEAAEEVDAKLRNVLDETVKSLQIEIPKSPGPKRRRKGSRRD